MQNFDAAFEVFSAARARLDRYRVAITADELVVSVDARFTARWKWDERDSAPRIGDRAEVNTPLHRLFAAVPSFISQTLEWAWRQWKLGATHKELVTSLQELFEWIGKTVGLPRARDPFADTTFDLSFE